MPELTIWMELKRTYGKDAYKHMKYRYISDNGKGQWKTPMNNLEIDMFLDPPEIEWEPVWTLN